MHDLFRPRTPPYRFHRRHGGLVVYCARWTGAVGSGCVEDLSPAWGSGGVADFEDADARVGALGQDEGFGNAHGLVGGLVGLGVSLWAYECNGLRLLHRFKVLRFNDG